MKYVCLWISNKFGRALTVVLLGNFIWLGALPSVAMSAEPSSPVVGVAAHLWGLSPAEIDKQLDLIAKAKLKVVRWDAPWKAVEVEKGKLQVPANWDYLVDRMRAMGLESMVILDYGNKFYDNGDKPVSGAAIEGFVRYAAHLAEHFEGRVKYFEVWNEWNSKIGNTSRGRSEDYAKLLRRTYAAIKNADKNAQVVGGGFSSSSHDNLMGYGKREDTFESLLAQDISAHCDAISIHPYVVYRDGPTRSIEGFGDLLKAVVQSIRKTAGMARKPIFITEIGWPTAKDSPRGVSEARQAEYLGTAIELSGQLGIAQVIIYELRDGNKDASDPEGNFGITRFNFSHKPAYRQLQDRQ